jgi:hypothetical protein
MQKNISRFIPLLVLCAGLLLSCGSGDDDDSSSPSDDDSGPTSDDTGDDADDSVSDDADDSGAGDDSGDDTQAEIDIYADLGPTGSQLKDLLGISSHMSGWNGDWQRDFEVQKLTEINARRIRRDFAWSSIEAENDVWNYEETDTFYDISLEDDLDFIALLDYGVGWAMPGGSTSEIPPEDWADFAGHVAERYCDRIKRYEIWNEENLGGRFWLPDKDPEHYGKLLAAGYDAVKAACPDAQVIFGGMSTADLPDSIFNGVFCFFDEVVETLPNVCDYFDAMSIHPYSFIQEWPPEFGFSLLFYDYPDVPGQTDLIRGQMAAAGCGDKPVMWTEYGWPSYFIDDYNQARYLARSLMLGAMKGVEGMYWYTFWDGHGASPVTENYFGLFQEPQSSDPSAQTAKPSYEAYKAVSEILGTTQYAGDLSAAIGMPDNAFALAFMEGSARLVVAIWDANAVGGKIRLPWPKNAVQVKFRDVYGDPVDGTWNDPIEIEPKPGPLYVEFSLFD